MQAILADQSKFKTGPKVNNLETCIKKIKIEIQSLLSSNPISEITAKILTPCDS